MKESAVSTRRYSGIVVLLIPATVFAVVLWVSKRAELDRRRADSPASHITQFTISSGMDLHPSFSPDGGSIAYSSDRSGRFEIYVQSQASGAREVQITSDGLQNSEPAWSPDGQTIAYSSGAGKGIFTVSASGGVPQRLTAFGSQPSWSPDGSQLAFRVEGVNSPANIWVIPAIGGSPHPVTHQGNPDGSHRFPGWHPDGMSILFSNQGANGGEIWSVRLREGTVSRVPGDREGESSPVYTPDGRNILYIAASATTGFSVWRRSLSDGRSLEVLPLGLTLPRGLAVDRSGRRIAYESGPSETRGNIYVAELPH